jgi:hypothetical protein
MRFSVAKLLAVVTWFGVLFGWFVWQFSKNWDWASFWLGVAGDDGLDSEGWDGNALKSWNAGHGVYEWGFSVGGVALLVAAVAIFLWMIPGEVEAEEEGEEAIPGTETIDG